MDENVIEFSTSPEKNFTIIQGTTGAGKTTLINAITWCLYGEELHNITDDPIYNEITENLTEPGGKFQIEVEIELLGEANQIITIHRDLMFYKDENGKIFDSFEGFNFYVIDQSARDNEPVEYPELFVDKHIPKDIEEYFFFNGQRLEDYFKENAGKVIKNSVFKITQLMLFERIITHLEERRDHFSDRITEISPKTGEIEQQIVAKEGLLVKNKERLQEAIKQRKLAERNITKFERDLKRIDSADINKLQIEREKLETDLITLDADIDDVKLERIEFLLKMSPIILTYSPLIKTKEIAENLKKKKFIPVKYRTPFLDDLIKDGTCICGTDLVHNEECMKNIVDLKERTSVLSDIGEEISDEFISLGYVLSNLTDFREKQKSLGKNIVRLVKEREQKSTRITEISVLLKDSEIEKVKSLETFLDENKRIKDSKIAEEATLSVQIKSDTDLIKKLKEKRSKEMEKNRELENLKDVLEFSENSLEAVRNIKADLIENTRVQIEKETKEQFINLSWKKTYVDVFINDNYNIKVLKKSGRYVDASGISSGEKLTLAFAFMAALNRISGFNLPIVIDTPMGILDKEIKLNIAKVLPNYLKDKQITLLVTGSEYTPEFRQKLLKRVDKEYRIKVIETEDGNKAEVVPNV